MTILAHLVQPTVQLVSEVADLSVSPVQQATLTLLQTVLPAKNAVVTARTHVLTVLVTYTALPVLSIDT